MSTGRFPQRIKRGSCVVSIYKTPTKGYDAFTVVHYDASGDRCRGMPAAKSKSPKAGSQILRLSRALTLDLRMPNANIAQRGKPAADDVAFISERIGWLQFVGPPGTAFDRAVLTSEPGYGSVITSGCMRLPSGVKAGTFLTTGERGRLEKSVFTLETSTEDGGLVLHMNS